MIIRITTEEQVSCPLCNRVIPKGRIVLKKVETEKIICLLCLIEIAELSQSQLQ